MGDWLKWIVAIAGLLYLVFVVSLLVKKKISELNTLVWIGTTAIILILSANTRWLDRLAELVGVGYPPSLLFLFSVLVLLLLTLYQSVQISVLQEKVKDLSQFIALEHAEKPSPGNSEKSG